MKKYASTHQTIKYNVIHDTQINYLQFKIKYRRRIGLIALTSLMQDDS